MPLFPNAKKSLKLHDIPESELRVPLDGRTNHVAHVNADTGEEQVFAVEPLLYQRVAGLKKPNYYADSVPKEVVLTGAPGIAMPVRPIGQVDRMPEPETVNTEVASVSTDVTDLGDIGMDLPATDTKTQKSK